MLTKPRIAAVIVAVGGTLLLASPAQAHQETRFTQLDLVSDVPGRAKTTDPALVNPWGLAAGPITPVWSANNGSDSSTFYLAKSVKVPLNVSVPGGPTGQVFNDTFMFAAKGLPATYLFDTESGDIRAWNVATGTSTAKVASTPGANYKGLALLHTSKGPLLLAAGFGDGSIDVYNARFEKVSLPGAFRDPGLPKGYAPFNVAAIGDRVYVAYALKVGEDEQAGAGLGIVDVYTKVGKVRHRFAAHGALNAPWAVVKAPSSFGTFAGMILVGNFGDGRINAYDQGGHFKGALRGTEGSPLAIDGLWGLQQGNPVAGGGDGLWFAAGIDEEAHGLLGILQPAR
jgi:uncharacterized protein (TIGR03118 family)